MIMREIKFRGKTDTGKWYYGDLNQLDNEVLISGVEMWGSQLKDTYGENKRVELEVAEVLPESVGQFTGLKDINGVDVYEGDVLNHPNSGLFECRFKDNGFYLFYKNIIQKSTTTEHMEIIGNIHENPELLK